MNYVFLDELPQSARDLISQIGMPAAVALIQAMPGARFPVPRGEDNNPAGAARFAQLVDVVGYEATLILVRNYGDDRDLYVPSCKKAILRARDRQIIAEYGTGVAVFDLGLKYKLSYRRIEGILAKPDTTPEPASESVQLTLL